MERSPMSTSRQTAQSALDGRVAVVTGASRGIGKGVSLELAAAGATVYLTGRTVHPADGVTGSLTETAAEIAEAGGVGVGIPVGCDHASDDDVAAVFARVGDERGHVDVLVNCVFNSAAFRSTIGRPFWELPISIWHDVVDLGTRSAYVASAHAAALMASVGGGLIVNISARGAERYRYNVAYGVGKAALDRMTRDMAFELREHGVAVISLWPGAIRTEHMDAMFGAGDRWALENFPDPDVLETPRYVGRAVTALASDRAVMARTGQRLWVAELGAAYGFADERGRTHTVPE
jgi:NAD(P)-dependent dehydrogenase (short-subunit alcohol dehydrogenase family)